MESGSIYFELDARPGPYPAREIFSREKESPTTQ